MADTNKNILITPNVGNTSDPTIIFSGANSSVAEQNITATITPAGNGTLTFSGSNGSIIALSATANDKVTITGNTLISDGILHSNTVLLDGGSINPLWATWDPSTTTLGSNTYIGAYDTSPQGIYIKPDGTKMYVAGNGTDSILEFNLTTSWDISSATYVQSFSVATQDTIPVGVWFNPDGTKMYMLGQGTGHVFEYDLSIRWNVLSAVYRDGRYDSSISPDTAPSGIFVSTDGTRIYTVGDTGNDIDEFILAVPHDLNTATVGSTFSIASYDTAPQDVFFKPDGTKMYVVGAQSATYGRDTILEFNLSSAWVLSSATYSQTFNIPEYIDNLPHDIHISPDGTKLFLVGINNDKVYTFGFGTAWDVSTLTDLNKTLSVGWIEATPGTLHFSTDGLTLFIAGPSDWVIKFTLSTAWDVTTATYADRYYVGYYEANAYGIHFSSDGSYLYLTGSSGDDINQYRLSTPWDIESISPTRKYVGITSKLPASLCFDADGSYCYLVSTGRTSIDKYTLATPWEINTAEYTSSYNVASKELTPTAVAFNAIGERMYVMGSTTDAIHEYALATPWDPTTAAYTRSFSFGALDATPTGLVFKPDGTKMFMLGDTNDRVYEFNLNSPTLSIGGKLTVAGDVDVTGTQTFYGDTNALGPVYAEDVTTQRIKVEQRIVANNAVINPHWRMTLGAVSSGNSTFYNTNTQDTSPQGVVFNADGTKMYIIGATNDRVYQYTLSTAWDITTSTYQSFVSVTNENKTPVGLFFNNDGTKMYVAGQVGGVVHQYTLSTAWDVATASYSLSTGDASLNVSARDTTMQDVVFGNNGLELYMIGSAGDSVYQYTLSTAYDLSTATYTRAFSIGAYDNVPTGVQFSADGTKMYIVGQLNAVVWQFNLSTAWNISTATHTGSTATYVSVAGQDATMQDFTFSADGTKMYAVGQGSGRVYQYNLGTAFTINTAVYSNYLSVLSQDYIPVGIGFSSDGTKMYMMGNATRRVYQYALSTAWDITTATYNAGTLTSLNIAGIETSVDGLCMDPTGSYAFIVGSSSGAVKRLDLSTAWDITTGTATQTVAVSGTIGTPTDLFISSDGLNMFVLSTTTIFKYTMSTAWDLTTATYTGSSLAINAVESAPTSLTFKSDGTKMYFSGTTTDALYQYNLSTAWDLSSAVRETVYVHGGGNTYGTWFDSTGTRMYICGTSSLDVAQYTLITPWDISTAYLVRRLYIGGIDTAPMGVWVKPDGAKIYVAGDTYDKITQITLGSAWEVDTADLGKCFNVLQQESNPLSLAIKPDGTKMYVHGSGLDAVLEYDMTTAYDVTTATFTGSTLVVGAGVTGICLNSDGTRLFTVDSTLDRITRYSLSTAWRVATGTAYARTFYVGLQEATGSGIALNSTGTKVFVLGYSSDRVWEYSMSTAYDLATIDRGQRYEAYDYETLPTGVFFSSTGLKMFVVGATGTAAEINEFTLSTAWDVSTAAYTRVLSLATYETAPSAVTFKTDGTRMFILGQGNRTILQYTLSTAFAINTTTLNATVYVGDLENTPSGITFSADGTKMFLLGPTNDILYRYTLGTAWDVTTATIGDNKNVLIQDTVVQSVAFSTDGTKMYVVGSTNDRVYQYALSTAWNVKTATYQSFVASGQDNVPTGIAFNNDGTKMYVSGQLIDSVLEYTLSTPWTVNTATSATTYQNRLFTGHAWGIDPLDVAFSSDGYYCYVTTGYSATYRGVLSYKLGTAFDLSTADQGETLDVRLREAAPAGLFFKSDGTRLYVVGTGSDIVMEYNVATPWNIKTATYSSQMSPGDSAPQGVYVSPDGKYMYVTGSTNDTVQQFLLTAPWSVNTATYVANVSTVTVGYESVPTDVYFKPDGTKMFVVGSAVRGIIEYTLTSPWSVATAAYQQTLALSADDQIPAAVSFTAGGDRMYVLGDALDRVYEYKLNTPWSMTGATLTDYIQLGAYLPSPAGMFIKSDGSKMYITSSNTDNIVTYSLPTTELGIDGTLNINGNQVIGAKLKVYEDTDVYGKLNVGGSVICASNDAITIPVGNTAQRPVTATAGQLRFNTDGNGPEYYNGTTWLGLGSLDGSTENRAAPSATYLRDVVGLTTSGVYWIKNTSMSQAVQVYCDLSYDGGGYMLLAYGYVANTGDNSLNKAIPNLNHDGTAWSYTPTSRASQNGLVLSPSSQKSALLLAKASTTMIMAAGGDPSSGGIDGYSYVYKFGIPSPSALTFNNHSYYYNGSMTNSGAITVTGLKGDIGTWTRYTITEAIGASWTDSYPAGYGCVESTGPKSGQWDYGPFFPSIHSGSRNVAPTNPTVVSSSPDIGVNGYTAGAQSYTYRGWYGAGIGVNQTGQTSIWVK